jgi:MraZ protein
MVFSGFYEHAIDEKNRLAIPAKFRSKAALEGESSSFVLVPGKPETSIWIYPERRFEELAARRDSSLIPEEDQLEFDQMFFPLAEHVDLDSQGRMLIPERMLAMAGLGREVVICGVRDHVEIRRLDEFKSSLGDVWKRVGEFHTRARRTPPGDVRPTGR